MKYLRVSILTCALAAIFLAACQTNPPVVPSAPADTALPAEETPAYPAPATEAPAAIAPEQVQGIYPGPVTANTSSIAWSAAEKSILGGEVAEIYLDNYFHVTLILKNGESRVTLQPALDTVSQLLESCGEPCKETSLVSE